MNYLAHARLHLHEPWTVAGTSLPDWLRVVDKRARLRPHALPATAPHSHGHALHHLVVGVRHHHHDDERFHTDAAFETITEALAAQIRALAATAAGEPDPRLRASTIAHVLVEMLLDRALLDDDPQLGRRYYDALAAIDPRELAEHARALTDKPLPHIDVLFVRFRSAEFLLDYRSDDGLLFALSRTLGRVGVHVPDLAPLLPTAHRDIAAAARALLR